MRTLVFNGWAAGPEAWALCSFPHDWVFSYLEQLDGLPEKVMEEVDEVVLVGFSMGGSTALRMLLAHPEKVKGLVLVSATPCMMEREDWKGMSLRRRAALKLGTQIIFRDDPSPLYAERNLDRGLDYLQDTDLRESLKAFSSLVPHPSSLPIHILQSERDGIVRPLNAAFLKSVFPQARVTMVPGGEHVLPIVRPELVDAAVDAVLDACLSDADRRNNAQ